MFTVNRVNFYYEDWTVSKHPNCRYNEDFYCIYDTTLFFESRYYFCQSSSTTVEAVFFVVTNINSLCVKSVTSLSTKLWSKDVLLFLTSRFAAEFIHSTKLCAKISQYYILNSCTFLVDTQTHFPYFSLKIMWSSFEMEHIKGACIHQFFLIFLYV